MNLTSAAQMLGRLNKVLARPTEVPSPAAVVGLLNNYIVPILEEIIARGQETNGAVQSALMTADAAFTTARQTLAGELFANIAEATDGLREQLALLALPEAHPAYEFLDAIEGAVSTYHDYLEEGEGEDEVEEGAPEGGEEGAEAVESAVEGVVVTNADAEPTEGPVSPEPATN